MSRFLLATAGLLALTAMPMTAFAAEAEAAETAAVHPHTAAMAKLEPLMRTFTVTGSQNEADGSVTTHTPSVATGESTVGTVGLLLKTAVDAGHGRPITTHLTLGYDQYRNIYRAAVLDNASGLLDIYEGQIEDGVLSMNNLRTDTFYMNGDMKVHFRLVWDMNKPVIDYAVDASIDGGETWLPYMMMEMTPVAG